MTMHQRVVLDNGLRILTSSLPQTRSVSMAVLIGAGSLYESDEMAGVSHFLEHLPFKGTRQWPTAKEVSEVVEGVGGILNASTDREMTVYWCKVASLHFQQSLNVLTDMVLHPLLDPKEIEKERLVVVEELRMSKDHPNYRVDALIDEALWPNQPMGRDVGGTQESVMALGRQQIEAYKEHQYGPANTVVTVAGNISNEEVVTSLEQIFRDWQPSESLPILAVQGTNGGPHVRMEQRKTEQAHVCIGLPGLAINHPQRYALTMMNVILGEGMSSRLFLELRENRGLVYDIHSSVSYFHDCGSLVTYCGVEPKNCFQAIETILDQLGQLRDGVPQKELDKAKELSKGRLLLRMEDSRSVTMWMGGQEMLTGQVRTVDEVVALIDAVTTEDVKNVAQELIKEEKLNLAVVGPYRSEGRFRKLLKL